LTEYVGGASIAGTKLKSSTGWASSNGVLVGGTNEYGWSALPGGLGTSGGSFGNAGNYGRWWSATENNASNAWYWNMNYRNGYVYRNNDSETFLFSVRCVADQ
jgi:uncharacterized protein (TIGR02145 family)